MSTARRASEVCAGGDPCSLRCADLCCACRGSVKSSRGRGRGRGGLRRELQASWNHSSPLTRLFAPFRPWPGLFPLRQLARLNMFHGGGVGLCGAWRCPGSRVQLFSVWGCPEQLE
eukprot:14330466-Alexandrium_andersonii.AAC.1